MLTTRVADADHVVSGALGLVRLICCLLVLASFALFAVDQASGASKHQVTELNAGTPTRTAAPISNAQAGQPRAAIDDAANVLEAPFRSVIGSSNQWVQRGFATLCALLLYGVGLGYLARFSQGRA